MHARSFMHHLRNNYVIETTKLYIDGYFWKKVEEHVFKLLLPYFF